MKKHSKTYWEGHKAYSKHGRKVLCPYAANSYDGIAGVHSQKRVQWWNGYLDAQTDEHLGHVFDKWNLGRMIHT